MKQIRLALGLAIAAAALSASVLAAAPGQPQNAQHTYYCNRCHTTQVSATTPDVRGCTSSSGHHAWVKKS